MRETERTRNNEKRERRNLTCMKKTKKKKREKKEGKDGEVERTCARGGRSGGKEKKGDFHIRISRRREKAYLLVRIYLYITLYIYTYNFFFLILFLTCRGEQFYRKKNPMHTTRTRNKTKNERSKNTMVSAASDVFRKSSTQSTDEVLQNVTFLLLERFIV